NLTDYLAAAIFTGGLIFEIIKKKIFEHRPFIPSALFVSFSLFLVWGTIVGMIGVFCGTVGIEQCYRDLLLFICPLFLLPIFYFEVLEESGNEEKIMAWSIFILWIVITTGSVVKIR